MTLNHQRPAMQTNQLIPIATFSSQTIAFANSYDSSHARVGARRRESSRELVTASEASRRASFREAGVKEAGSETAGRRTGTG